MKKLNVNKKTPNKEIPPAGIAVTSIAWVAVAAKKLTDEKNKGKQK